MGYYYNAACTDQTCSAGCCNAVGTCPDFSSRVTNVNQCWHTYQYYEGDSSCSSQTGTSNTCCYTAQAGYYKCDRVAETGGVIGGAVGGAIAGLILLICCIVCLCRRYRNKKQQQRQVVVPYNGDKTVIYGSTPNINYNAATNISYGSPAVNYGTTPPTNLTVYPSDTSFNGMTQLQPYPTN